MNKIHQPPAQYGCMTLSASAERSFFPQWIRTCGHREG